VDRLDGLVVETKHECPTRAHQNLDPGCEARLGSSRLTPRHFRLRRPMARLHPHPRRAVCTLVPLRELKRHPASRTSQDISGGRGQVSDSAAGDSAHASGSPRYAGRCVISPIDRSPSGQAVRGNKSMDKLSSSPPGTASVFGPTCHRILSHPSSTLTSS
jgi:hypothetical protein